MDCVQRLVYGITFCGGVRDLCIYSMQTYKISQNSKIQKIIKKKIHNCEILALDNDKGFCYLLKRLIGW